MSLRLALVVLLTLTGCAGSRSVGVATTLAGVNAELAGRTVDLEHADGETIRVYGVHLGRDSTAYRADRRVGGYPREGPLVWVPTNDVARIALPRGSHAGLGVLVGAAPGAVIALGGYISGITTDDYNKQFGAYIGMAGGAMIAGGGALVGGVVGALIPRRRVVIYEGPVGRYDRADF